jgi:hypothetical protein
MPGPEYTHTGIRGRTTLRSNPFKNFLFILAALGCCMSPPSAESFPAPCSDPKLCFSYSFRGEVPCHPRARAGGSALQICMHDKGKGESPPGFLISRRKILFLGAAAATGVIMPQLREEGSSVSQAAMFNSIWPFQSDSSASSGQGQAPSAAENLGKKREEASKQLVPSSKLKAELEEIKRELQADLQVKFVLPCCSCTLAASWFGVKIL